MKTAPGHVRIRNVSRVSIFKLLGEIQTNGRNNNNNNKILKGNTGEHVQNLLMGK